MASVDPRLQTVLDYIDKLDDAQNAAIARNDQAAALALHAQIEQANETREKLILLILNTDDSQIAGLTATVKMENDKLQRFSNQIEAVVKDVALAGQVASALAKVATMVAAL